MMFAWFAAVSALTDMLYDRMDQIPSTIVDIAGSDGLQGILDEKLFERRLRRAGCSTGDCLTCDCLTGSE
jgi:hypothetical protein